MLVLCILDGWGMAPAGPHNPLSPEHLPHWNHLLQTYPWTTLEASGEAVGLPTEQMGNSEVGHMSMSAGRIVWQDLPRISRNLTPDFMETHLLPHLPSGPVHMMGLFSPGGVHSYQDHWKTVLTFLNTYRVPVVLHLFLDGRDTPPRSARGFWEGFLEGLPHPELVQQGSIGGRYYGMDRDHRWDRTEKAFNALLGTGPTTPSFEALLNTVKEEDEFVPPHVVEGYEGIVPGSSLLGMNFRADRIRQILSALLEPSFSAFPRSGFPYFEKALSLSPISKELDSRLKILFPRTPLVHTLGAVVSEAGLKQLRLAETEKYAHVTFFFNGGKETPFPKEDRILIPSPQVSTYDLAPGMAAEEIFHQLEKALRAHAYDFYVVNFANGDMVGHSGNEEAVARAAHVLDVLFGKLEKLCLEVGAICILTADHGNAECMYDAQHHQPHTAHTTNPVPFVVINGGPVSLQSGILPQIAPTVLELMGLQKPPEMTAKSLIQEKRVGSEGETRGKEGGTRPIKGNR